MNDATIQAPTTGAAPGTLGISYPALPADLCDNCPTFSPALIPVDLYGSDPDSPGVTFGTRMHCCLRCATQIAVDGIGEFARDEAERGEERVL